MHYLDYNEMKQHGTADFPIEYYYVGKFHPQYFMPFHWHMEPEIIRILEGRFQFYLDDREIIASAGDIVFINEGTIHGGIPENCLYECIVFDLNALLLCSDTCKRYIRQVSKHHIHIHNHFPKEDTSLHQAVGRLFHSLKEKSPGSELSALGALYEIFGIIFYNQLYEPAADKTGRSQNKMVQLKPVLEYIETSYWEVITLEDLSRTAGMTSKYFCRYFRAIIHRTPMDYLNYYRIERACLILSTEDLSITEVAYRCGFNDSSYFVKTFKKYKNTTPKQYRMRNE